MARLVTCGFEAQHFTGEGQGINATKPVNAVLDTTFARSGLCALKCDPIDPAQWGSGSGLSVLNRNYFARVYFYFQSFPTNDCYMLAYQQGASPFARMASVRFIAASGSLQLAVAGTNLRGSPVAISTGQWYMVELRMIAQSAAADTAEWRLNGTVQATTTEEFTTVAPDVLNVGTDNSTGSPVIWIDDVALNDDNGASPQISYPGQGKIVLLRPVADTSRVGWVGGAGGTTNLWDAVNNRPPIGKTAAASADTDQIEDATNNATDTYVAACEAYNVAVASGGGGMAAADTVTLTQAVGVGGSGTTTSRTLAIRSESNPGPDASEGTAATPATVFGTFPTGWVTVRGTHNYAPSVTAGTRPGVRVRKGTASTTAMAYCAMGLYVEYVPATPKSLPAPSRTARNFLLRR